MLKSNKISVLFCSYSVISIQLPRHLFFFLSLKICIIFARLNSAFCMMIFYRSLDQAIHSRQYPAFTKGADYVIK